MEAVASLISQGKSRAEILAHGISEFGASVRAIDDYIRRARERLALSGVSNAEQLRTAFIARAEALSARLERVGAYSALVQNERLLADIYGLRQPPRIAQRPQPTPTAFSTDDALEEIIAAAECMARVLTVGSVPPAQRERLEAAGRKLLAVGNAGAD